MPRTRAIETLTAEAAAQRTRTPCPHCLEEIIEGAGICRFCGKKQPAKAKPAGARQNRSAWIVGGVSLALFFFFVWAALSYSERQDRVRAAAACSGQSADALNAMAEKAAREGNISTDQATDLVVIYACPRLANRQ